MDTPSDDTLRASGSAKPRIGAEESVAQVLLVDDDEVARLVGVEALDSLGFALDTAASGEQALASLALWAPDIVLLDAVMPGLDGFESCRRLRAMRGLETLPVIMLTGLDDEASIRKAFEAGATDFFVKNPSWTLLAERMRYVLRASRDRAALNQSMVRLARAQSLARLGSVEWRLGTAAPWFSDQALEVLGLEAGEAMPWRDLLRRVAPAHRLQLAHARRRAASHGVPLACDIELLARPGGTAKVIHVEAEGPLDAARRVAVYSGIVQDVTERLAARARIEHLANFDALTELPNRAQMELRIERAIELAQQTSQEVALLLIDLDRFDNVNQTLGSAAGDQLLREMARRLRGCVRHTQASISRGAQAATASAQHLECIGRTGGDEFMALLADSANSSHAERVAQRINRAVSAPVVAGGQELVVTAGIGIAVYPRDAVNAADLVRSAIVALSAVKAQGSNATLQFHPSLAGKGRERLALESALHQALERNELVLHYQPKVDMRGARLAGAEALMRWQRNGVLVAPAEFIPIAEESGLIVPMSEWALREAARQARSWQDRFGFSGAIAVNLPNRMFERPDLVDLIHDVAARAGVAPAAIGVEITESGLMNGQHGAIATLHRLEASGVQVAIDDFGTGYSSLAYLTTLPICELKIDRSFVKELGRQPKSEAVVGAIMALADSLRLRVVAEGVETATQMQILQRLGCVTMQGFLFSRALPPREFEIWHEQLVRLGGAPWSSVENSANWSGAAQSTDLASQAA